MIEFSIIAVTVPVPVPVEGCAITSLLSSVDLSVDSSHQTALSCIDNRIWYEGKLDRS